MRSPISTESGFVVVFSASRWLIRQLFPLRERAVHRRHDQLLQLRPAEPLGRGRDRVEANRADRGSDGCR